MNASYDSSCFAEDFPNEEVVFFENKIRPLLSEHCLECHSSEKQESDLRLDSRQAILKGGASGEPGAITGNIDGSLIVQSVRHTNDYEMPPNEKLSDAEIADLEKWVAIGMPWPKSVTSIAKLEMPQLREEHRKNHWSFQQVQRPIVPQIHSKTKSESGLDLDRFVRAKLESKKLPHSGRADKRTLIRRAYFDLIGLPPTYSEVEAFVRDTEPDAYPQLIDRLLDSKHYGERWARHWLDVARYADTSGYAFNKGDRSYPFAFTYRDYVIKAFNSDTPYDQFIKEQLAADHLEIPEDKNTLAALGFITVGRNFISSVDTFDDQVDVATRGLMGLTVSCARCHDHKYDAIPTEDYYSLYSVFENNYRPSELPLMGDPADLEKFNVYFEELEKRKAVVESFQQQKYKQILAHVRTSIPDYVVRAALPGKLIDASMSDLLTVDEAQINIRVIEKWRKYLASKLRTSPSVLQKTTELLVLSDENFEQKAEALVATWAIDPKKSNINPLLLKALQTQPIKTKVDVAAATGKLFTEIYQEWEANGAKRPPLGQFKGHEYHIARLVLSEKSPAMFALKDLDGILNQEERKEIRKLRDNVAMHNAAAPGGIARAMVVRDKEKLRDTPVMIRGNVGRRGKVAPRRFVSLLTGSERPEFKSQSGRLELAEHIASSDNPLTARVFVNRVWMHHFSSPLVDTPSDFGIRCEAPIQQDLLDYLADDFMKHGWSIKHLHRRIMLSDTYCQISKDIAECAEVDPGNRFLWKMNRRRLEFEPLRDSLLSVSGNLDPTLYGKAIKLFKQPFTTRRSIYGHIDRQDLPNLYRVFDLASPDQSAAKRTRTTVPQQSLFMMNSPFVIDQARSMVANIKEFVASNRQERVQLLYRRLFQREPNELELKTGCDFIENASPSDGEKNLGTWQRYAHALMCTNEFEFVD